MLQILVSLALGALVGYASYKIIETLFPRFLDVLNGFFEILGSIFAYISEKTKSYLAAILKDIQDNWSDFSLFISNTFGFIRECVIYMYRHDRNVILGILDQETNESTIVNIGVAPEGVQLPENQAIVGSLTLS